MPSVSQPQKNPPLVKSGSAEGSEPKIAKKSETSVDPPAETIAQQLVNVVEKKIRNLEKRKSKLDGYKAELDSGKTLTEEQKEALGKVGEVVGQVELCKDLLKQIQVVAVEASREKKAADKKALRDKTQDETAKLKELSQTRDLLELLRGPGVKEEFLNGTNGATQLSREQFQLLDDLFYLLFPKPDGSNIVCTPSQYEVASQHSYALITGSNKKALGNATYKELRSLLHSLRDSEFFACRASPSERETVAPATETAEIPVATVEPIRDWSSNGTEGMVAMSNTNGNQSSGIEFLQSQEQPYYPGGPANDLSFSSAYPNVINPSGFLSGTGLTESIVITNSGFRAPDQTGFSVEAKPDLSAPQPPPEESLHFGQWQNDQQPQAEGRHGEGRSFRGGGGRGGRGYRGGGSNVPQRGRGGEGRGGPRGGQFRGRGGPRGGGPPQQPQQ